MVRQEFTSSPHPPYNAPRQTSAKDTLQTKVNADVEDISESEDKGKGISDSDSEDDTQFGVVWEKFKDVTEKTHKVLDVDITEKIQKKQKETQTKTLGNRSVRVVTL
jgi:hypothetical protein